MKLIIPCLLFSLWISSCNDSDKTDQNNTSSKTDQKDQKDKASNPSKIDDMTEQTSTPLKDQLDEKRANFEARATDEKKRIYSEGLDAVEQSGILDKAKNIGDKAPNFNLKNAKGEMVSLNDYLSKGPVVLTWYRGGWCPYCNITKAQGANLLALTPEIPDKSISTQEKNNLEFEVLSDVGNKVGETYNIIFKLTEEVATSYQTGFDLHGYNGDESNELPLAATYVIDTSGTIKYAFLDVDYRNRAEPLDILTALKAL